MKAAMGRYYALAAFALAVNVYLAAAAPKDSRTVYLKATTIDTRGEHGIRAMEFGAGNHDVEETRGHLFHFYNSESVVAAIKWLDRYGVTRDQEAVQYIPQNTLLVHCSLEVATLAEEQLTALAWTSPFLPAYKLSDSLRDLSDMTPKNDEISVSVLAGASRSVFDFVSSAWPSCHSEVISDTKVTISLGCMGGKEDRQDAIRQISHHTGVVWIERVDTYEYSNRSASMVVANGSGAKERFQQGNRVGLDGRGQIVGVADSGLDWDSCFFYDKDHKVPYDKVDSAHRKIVTYRVTKGAATHDFFMGHGTHVMGSVAGDARPADSESTVPQFNGMAPGAKLAILGMGTAEGGIIVPKDLYTDLFPYAYDAGARIHTNSWSGGMNEYSTGVAEIDRYVWEHKDFLVLFAAGNDGDNGAASVKSPGTAKNIVTVGATQNDPAAFVDYAGSNMTFAIEGIRAGLCENLFQYQDERFCRAIGKHAPCEEMQEHMCKVFTTPEACCKYPIDPLKCCPEAILKRAKDEATLANSENLASFSARGPTKPDGRIKPEVTAPGKPVLSSRSDGDLNTFQCGENQNAKDAAINAFSGTSMATPLVAGAAAIVRQYLVDGYYPTGVANKDHSVKPSAALLKAILVASAQPMKGLIEEKHGNSSPIDPTPSMNQGFGRVELNSIMTKDKSAFTFKEARIPKTGASDRFCVKPLNKKSPGGMLKVTLVWTDAPGSVATSQPLVNNLDLLVTDPAGYEHRGNGGSEFDHTNNVEQVALYGAHGMHVVHVHAERIIIDDTEAGGQPYALVVSGDYALEDCGDAPIPCPLSCMGRGKCNTDTSTCICDEGYSGLDCSATACPRQCSGHGVCRTTEGTCECAKGYGGRACARRVCPENCNGHGECNEETGECSCEEGFSGPACKESMCPYSCSNHGTCGADSECRCDDTRIGVGCCGLKAPLKKGSRHTVLVPQYSPFFAFVELPTKGCKNIKITLGSSGGDPKLWVTSDASKFETCQLNTCTEDDYEFRDDEVATEHTVTIPCGKAPGQLMLQIPNEGNDDFGEDFQAAACTVAIDVEENDSGVAEDVSDGNAALLPGWVRRIFRGHEEVV